MHMPVQTFLFAEFGWADLVNKHWVRSSSGLGFPILNTAVSTTLIYVGLSGKHVQIVDLKLVTPSQVYGRDSVLVCSSNCVDIS